MPAQIRRSDRAQPQPLADFELEMFLPYRIATLAHGLSRALADVYSAEFGVSIAEWRVLANLGRGPMGAGALADASSLDKPAVTRALQKLTRRGLVARAVPNEDRRRAQLALTSKGHLLYRQIAERALDWEARLFEGFSVRERAALDGLLDRLKARIVRGEIS